MLPLHPRETRVRASIALKKGPHLMLPSDFQPFSGLLPFTPPGWAQASLQTHQCQDVTTGRCWNCSEPQDKLSYQDGSQDCILRSSRSHGLSSNKAHRTEGPEWALCLVSAENKCFPVWHLPFSGAGREWSGWWRWKAVRTIFLVLQNNFSSSSLKAFPF